MTEEKQLKFALKDVDKLKMLVNSLNNLVKEIRLTSNDAGLHCAAMDPANVAHISFDWLKEDFTEWKNPQGGHEFIVSTEQLKKSIKRAKAADVLEATITDEGMEVILDDGATKRTFAIPLLTEEGASKPTPQLEFKSKVELPCDRWTTSVEDVADCGTSAQMMINEAVFVIQAWSDSKTEKTKVEFRDGEAGITTETEVYGSEGASKYSLDYFKHFLEPAKKTDSVTLQWTKDYPCQVTYALENLTIRYILAPRVDND